MTKYRITRELLMDMCYTPLPPEELVRSFIFEHSPQGHDHWADIAFRGKPMTEDDRKFLAACKKFYNREKFYNRWMK